MKTKSVETYASVKEFGKALGLTDLEIELIHQKKTLIERIKSTRIKNGLSQTELATLVGSKQPAIARMESGQISEVSMDFLLKSALALEITVTIKPRRTAA